MYKLLSIILFAVGISSSSQYDSIIQSVIDFRVEDIKRDINSILDFTKYRIEVEYEVSDTIFVKDIINQDGSVFFLKTKLKKQ